MSLKFVFNRNCAVIVVRWLASGLYVHKDILNTAKYRVTRLVQEAKSSFFTSKILEGTTAKQLHNTTSGPLGKSKTPLPP